MTQAILWAMAGTGFTFFMTSMGSATVFFFKKEISASIQRIFLGFAARGDDCSFHLEPADSGNGRSKICWTAGMACSVRRLYSGNCIFNAAGQCTATSSSRS